MSEYSFLRKTVLETAASKAATAATEAATASEAAATKTTSTAATKGALLLLALSGCEVEGLDVRDSREEW